MSLNAELMTFYALGDGGMKVCFKHLQELCFVVFVVVVVLFLVKLTQLRHQSFRTRQRRTG